MAAYELNAKISYFQTLGNQPGERLLLNYYVENFWGSDFV